MAKAPREERSDKRPCDSKDSGDNDGDDISFRQAFWTWVRIGLLSFGGPAGQISVMHRILVEEKRWISEKRFLHALNYCMLLPGPEAQQLTVYIGWLLHRVAGGIVAGVLFVLPGAVVILGLSFLYAAYQDTGPVQALFFGIKAAVLAVVLQAVLRIGGRALRHTTMHLIAAAAFIAIFFFDVAFPLIVLAGALVGLAGGWMAPERFSGESEHDDAVGKGEDAVVDRALARGGLSHTRPSGRRAVRITAICLLLWLGPTAVLAAWLGYSSVYVQEAVFFSKMAVVTFGGAYAVLAYVAQEAVATHGWLAPGEMMDGLGMAEATPGPLIMVVQFVGFMGAFRDAGGLDPMLAGTFGALLTTWVTFVPCFLWIFLGAPYVEALRNNRALSAAMAGITAAVVGVILNLAIWFGLHVLFGEVNREQWRGLVLHVPVLNTLEPFALLLAVASFLALRRYGAGMIVTLLASGMVGAAYYLLFLDATG